MPIKISKDELNIFIENRWTSMNYERMLHRLISLNIKLDYVCDIHASMNNNAGAQFHIHTKEKKESDKILDLLKNSSMSEMVNAYRQNHTRIYLSITQKEKEFHQKSKPVEINDKTKAYREEAIKDIKNTQNTIDWLFKIKDNSNKLWSWYYGFDLNKLEKHEDTLLKKHESDINNYIDSIREKLNKESIFIYEYGRLSLGVLYSGAFGDRKSIFSYLPDIQLKEIEPHSITQIAQSYCSLMDTKSVYPNQLKSLEKKPIDVPEYSNFENQSY